MTEATFGAAYAGSAAENYERYFVPSIGEPVAEDLMKAAALRTGQRVLDVACGTGVVARLAASSVGDEGTVVGLDVNPGMLQVARARPRGETIDWHAAPAEAMPFADGSFDVALCQMGLQFIPDRAAALREMWRVLVPGGRLVMNVPGPTPPGLEILADSLARHVGPQAAGFAHAVFSLHAEDQIRGLLEEAGFQDVTIDVSIKTLRLPPPKDFLWQYVSSTPLSNVIAEAEPVTLESVEREVCTGWEPMVSDGHLFMDVRMSTASGRKGASRVGRD